MRNQRQLISEARLRVRGIGKEIADLEQERYCLELLIARDEYISDTRKRNLTKKIATKKAYGNKNKIDKLKAAMGAVREG